MEGEVCGYVIVWGVGVWGVDVLVYSGVASHQILIGVWN